MPVRETYYDRVNHYTLVASLSPTLRRLAPTLDAVQAFVTDTLSGGGLSGGVSGSGSDRRTSGPAR